LSVEKLAYYAQPMPTPLVLRYYRLFQDSRRILDIGGGVGTFARHRPDDSYEIVSVDVDSGAVQEASRWSEALEVDLEHQGLPFESSSFDAVLAKDVLEHLTSPWGTVREISRVLRPGGIVIASLVMAIPARVWADYTHVRGFTPKSAAMLFEDAGFHVHEIWPMGGVPLTARLGAIDTVPALLRFPLLRRLWGASWEVFATTPRDSA
jgi:SAM-dependent methyltransferase